jgi:catechol 2,3-dioxygenase-like lactoylglutathione lyase family enzyme
VTGSAAPRLAQLAFCTDDVAATVRTHTQAYGFADAGGHVFWGQYLADVQQLGDDATCMTWWMVGRQELVQLEFFRHSEPPQRPLPAEWRPNALGWVRWGVVVPDFDETLRRLARRGVAPMADPQELHGLRRACVRDPHTGVVVELLEEGVGTPGGIRPRAFDLVPAVAYAAVSVGDLDQARTLLVDVVGLEEDRHTVLHTPAMEALWGLGGARCETVLLRAGDMFVELVRYDEPAGRPRGADRRLSDQGFMNIGFAVREKRAFDAILERAAGIGLSPSTTPLDRPSTEAYLDAGDGLAVEILLIPREYEDEYGFVPRPRFPAPPPWPRPRTAPAEEPLT